MPSLPSAEARALGDHADGGLGADACRPGGIVATSRIRSLGRRPAPPARPSAARRPGLRSARLERSGRHHLVDEAEFAAPRRHRTARRSGNSAGRRAARSRAATKGAITAGIRPSRTSRQAKLAPLGRDRDVAAGDEPDAAAERRAVDHADHRLGAVDRSLRIRFASAMASRSFSARPIADMRFIQSRSAPAEKLCPSPASTTTRTAASLAQVAERLRQLRDQRLVERVVHLRPVQREPSRPCPRVLDLEVRAHRLHPEDAEARRLDRRVERGRQAQRQRHARVGRIDQRRRPTAARRRSTGGPAPRIARGSAP